MKLSQCQALQKWLDNVAEVKLKEALGEMMRNLKTPALILRSINLNALSAMNDLGLKLPGDAEVDYVSGAFLHVVIFGVKRSDTCPWQTKCSLPNKLTLGQQPTRYSMAGVIS